MGVRERTAVGAWVRNHAILASTHLHRPALSLWTSPSRTLHALCCQAVTHAQSREGLQVVGYYQANARLADRELGGVGKKIADRVDALCRGSVALVVRGTEGQGACC